MATKKSAKFEKFMLLPVRGLRSDEMRHFSDHKKAFVEAASSRLTFRTPDSTQRNPTMNLIHSISETGPKLVEMGPEEIAAMRVSDPGVRAIPIVIYELARRPILEVASEVQTATIALAAKLTIQCIDSKTKAPLPGVHFVAFTDFKQRIGASGQSDKQG